MKLCQYLRPALTVIYVVSGFQRGKLIVFEGPDGVGKSTLSRALVNEFAELKVPYRHLPFPGREEGTIGRLVHDLHLAPKAFDMQQITAIGWRSLYLAAHLDTLEQRVLPALEKGQWVVLDHFWWSIWVYGTVGGVDTNLLDAMINVELVQWGEIKPDILFLVDRKEDPLHEDFDRLHKEYHTLKEREQAKYPIRVVDNNGPMDNSLDQLLGSLRGLIPQLKGTLRSSQPVLSEEQLELLPAVKGQLTVFAATSPARATVVFDTFWRFAAERQEIFFRKLESCPPPWTTDPIISRYKFTNTYRASDRVSQYLIREVIYEGNQSPQEVFFRTILFKLFNKIETWEALKARLGAISYQDYSFVDYDHILSEAISSNTRIYSGAYIMPPGKTFGYRRKHRNHLKLLERMMEDEAPYRVATASSMKQAFDILRSYPGIGDFLAYQYVTDLNYSTLLNFSEMEFVMAGPGATDGIHKCFSNLGELSETDIIQSVAETQDREFERLGLQFRSLWGRPLQLIDCQNIFCEVSKYSRVKHPDIEGSSGRTRIKQGYRPASGPLEYWFPPKWGINHLIRKPERRK